MHTPPQLCHTKAYSQKASCQHACSVTLHCRYMLVIRLAAFWPFTPTYLGFIIWFFLQELCAVFLLKFGHFFLNLQSAPAPQSYIKDPVNSFNSLQHTSLSSIVAPSLVLRLLTMYFNRSFLVLLSTFTYM